MLRAQPPSSRPRRVGLIVAMSALVAVVALAVGAPAVAVASGIAAGALREGPRAVLAAGAIDGPAVMLLLRTVRIAAVIGVLATVVAWPAAWAVRGRGRAWAGVLLVPMLLPSYLAYAGWGLLRSPGTWTGNLLSRAGPPPWSSEPGYWPLLAGSVLAVAGLVLWSWPLAAVILGAGAARVDESSLEALDLEPCPAWRRWWCIAGMMRGPILAAVLATSLVMLGSAVPLHLAQVQTWAVHTWLLLDQTPADRHWTVWVNTWPLALTAIMAGVAVWSRAFGRAEGGHAPSSQPLGSRRWSAWAVAATGVAWTLSVVVPAALFAWFVPNWRAVSTFWHVHHEPFLGSLGTAGVLGAAGLGVAGAAWLGVSAGGRAATVARGCVGALLVAGLMPGVLVGSASSAAWNSAPWLRFVADSQAAVILGHLARYGFLCGLAGVFLARSEPEDERASRRLDGADGLMGWSRACLPWGAGTVAAAGLAVGILGFHEIESAVILQPPGVDSFTRQMLQFLHYARIQELCVGALLTTGVGSAMALGMVGLERVAAVRRGRTRN